METNSSDRRWLITREWLMTTSRWFIALGWTIVLVATSGTVSAFSAYLVTPFVLDGNPPRSSQEFAGQWFVAYWLVMAGISAYTHWQESSLNPERKQWSTESAAGFLGITFLLWCARDGIPERVLGLLLFGAMMWAIYRAQTIREEVKALCDSGHQHPTA